MSIFFHQISAKVLDLSSNFITGKLPEHFGGGDVEYFNISHNNISGEIPEEFANKFSTILTIDLPFNNLTGAMNLVFSSTKMNDHLPEIRNFVGSC
ncbi:putative endo-polygalacturonase [Helianthus annuus]|nr:putative endo-polygalacturonase [Helianthus annuus]